MAVRWGSPGRPARQLTVAAAIALACTLAACSDDSSGGDELDESSRKGGTLSQFQPLTGEPVDGDLPTYPVVTVKIDNTASSAPQIGLKTADLITEELVEGGLTRLAATYYSSIPDLAGPVRSMRASDIGIVTPVESVLVAAGGAPPTRARIADAEIPTYGEGDPGFFRADDRPAPYNLMVELPALVNSLDEAAVPPQYLPFGDDAPGGGKKATTFDVMFSAGHTTSWEYQDGGYVRTNSYSEPDADFVADSVLVLRVRQGDAGYKDPAGNPVPETLYEGTGDARLFHDGKVVEGSWTKDQLDEPLQLETRDGDLTVPRGNTFIELVPVDTGGVQVSG